jgi:hypothetical protein
MNQQVATKITNDYLKYRGKCKELSEQAVADNPTLTLVRGHYVCPFWGKQAHWWTVRFDGSIYDPSKDQFPSKGIGEYVPFNGIVECAQCGVEMKEDEVNRVEGNYGFCSTKCAMRFVGL